MKHKLMRTCAVWAGCGAVFAFAPTAASAHPWFDLDQANPGKPYHAKLHIPHGCETNPTISLVVKTPEGFDDVQGVSTDKWKSSAVKKGSAYEVSFEGGEVPWNEDAVFEFTGHLTDVKPGKLYFLVIQKCKGGDANRWIETPKPNQSEHELDWPAAALEIVAGEIKQSGAPAMAHGGHDHGDHDHGAMHDAMKH
jgi:periplasmic copper chaperone A